MCIIFASLFKDNNTDKAVSLNKKRLIMIDTSLTNKAFCVVVLDENKNFCYLLDYFGDEYYVNFATAQIVMGEYENEYDEDIIVAVITDDNWPPEYDEKNIIKSKYLKHK